MKTLSELEDVGGEGAHSLPSREKGDSERELLCICQISTDIKQLMHRLISFFQSVTGCEAVGVRLRQGEDFPYYTTQGFPETFVKAENLLCAYDGDGRIVRDATGNPVLECMCGNVLSGRINPALPFFTAKGSFWTNSTSALLAQTSEADRQARTRNRCNGEGYESVALIPLKNQEAFFGLFQFNDHRKNRLSPERIAQLEDLVAYVSLTLAKHLADEQLRASEEKYRLVVENAQEAILLIQDERLVLTNPATVKLSGYTHEQLSSVPFLTFVHPDDHQLVMGHHRNRLRGGTVPSSYVVRLLCQDGALKWLEVHGSLVQWNGRPASLNFLADITEQRQAEMERLENEQNLKAILNASQESIQLLDLDGRILLSNEAAARRLHQSVEEVVGRNVFDMFPPEIAEYRKKCCQQVIDTGLPVSLRDQRSGIDLEAHLWPVVDQAGKVCRIALFAMDITERRKAEIQLTASHELLNNLARQVPGVIYQYRLYPDGRSAFPYASPGMHTIYEMTPEEVQGDATPVFGRLHPDDRERVTEEIYKSARSLETFFCEFRVLLPRQGLRWRWSQAQPQKMDDGSILWHGIISDITERKQAEEALQASEEDLRESQRIAHVGSWRLDLASNQVVWSNELYSMYGFDPRLPPPPYTEHHKLFTPESWQKLVVAMQHTRDTGVPYDLELETLRADGGRGWMWVHGMTILGGKGEITGLRGVAQDISEWKRVEEEKKKLSAQLQQAQKMEAIGTLAGGIAHDFNNILGAIIGYSELALDDCPPDSALAEDARQILKAGNRAKDLVKQILAFSRQAKVNHIPLRPEVVIKEAVKLLRASLPTTISIRQDIEANCGVILADPTQLHQIMMNLCTNAFHAMEMQGGVLTVSLKGKVLTGEDLQAKVHMQPGKYVQLSIGDTGIGIAPDIRERIFDPYFTTKGVGKGTGMGLAMVHGIVRSYGGAIVCDSRLGEGTVFHVTLPIAEVAEAEEIEVAHQAPGGKEHILLVDDEQMLVELGKAMLERLGYRVTTRTNSLEALATFQNQPDDFDLIITDQTMPGMTGIDLARRLLQLRPYLPIILCTGYSNLISEEKATAMGIKGFAMKPLTKQDIAGRIRKVLDECRLNTTRPLGENFGSGLMPASHGGAPLPGQRGEVPSGNS